MPDERDICFVDTKGCNICIKGFDVWGVSNGFYKKEQKWQFVVYGSR